MRIKWLVFRLYQGEFCTLYSDYWAINDVIFKHVMRDALFFTKINRTQTSSFWKPALCKYTTLVLELDNKFNNQHCTIRKRFFCHSWLSYINEDMPKPKRSLKQRASQRTLPGKYYAASHLRTILTWQKFQVYEILCTLNRQWISHPLSRPERHLARSPLTWNNRSSRLFLVLAISWKCFTRRRPRSW